MLPEHVRRYLLIDLKSGPGVLARLLGGFTDWDARPDAARFSPREMVAHLADWESVFLKRLTDTRDTESAVLQGLDEGQIAIDHDYARADPAECLHRYAAGRDAVVSLLNGLAPAQWQRIGNHTELGLVTLEVQAVLIAAHDGYHRQQVLDWLGTLKAGTDQ